MYQNDQDINQVYILNYGKKGVCYDAKDLYVCQGKMADYTTNCKDDQDCCSTICSIGEYNSMCCPRFTAPDGKGNCN